VTSTLLPTNLASALLSGPWLRSLILVFSPVTPGPGLSPVASSVTLTGFTVTPLPPTVSPPTTVSAPASGAAFAVGVVALMGLRRKQRAARH
jgi:hypothetical protein